MWGFSRPFPALPALLPVCPWFPETSESPRCLPPEPNLTCREGETYNRIEAGHGLEGVELTPEEEGSGLGTVALQTVGCKLNQAETDSLARKFLKAGCQVVAPDAPADIYLLNTCTVTSTADQKCRKLLRHARRRNPDALVVATGCYVERAPADILAIDGVSIAVGNDEKARLVEIVGDKAGLRGPVLCTGQPQPTPLRTRSLVKIQEGCSQWCSFCIVPRVRGPESSRPPEEVLSELKDRVAEGYKEIVLTGTRIGRYEHAGGLTGLVELILGETDVERVRLSSLEPADINPELLRLRHSAGTNAPALHSSRVRTGRVARAGGYSRPGRDHRRHGGFPRRERGRVPGELRSLRAHGFRQDACVPLLGATAYEGCPDAGPGRSCGPKAQHRSHARPGAAKRRALPQPDAGKDPRSALGGQERRTLVRADRQLC